MSTNFDFLIDKDIFKSFANSAMEAEKSLLVSPATCAILSRRALELAIKWLYSFDDELVIPYQDNISSLIHEHTFRQIIEPRLFPLIKYVIKLGNTAVHTNASITMDEAILSLRNLHEMVRWIDYCYAVDYTAGEFNEKLLNKGEEKRIRPQELKDLYEKLSAKDKRLQEIRDENEKLRETITSHKKQNINTNDFVVDKISEEETRQRYIDIELKLAGWEMNRDWQEEVDIVGMPSPTGKGRVDYVLYGDNGKPLAVIEAKKTSVDPIVGSHQAKLYADCLEQMYSQRPLIFTTNGFEINFTDDCRGYPQRKILGIFTKDEMQRMVNRRQSQKPLNNVDIKDEITNRYYQKEAIMSVCDAVDKKQRKMLLVMATGSGKTRTAISIVDVLTRHNYTKNILFLADRKALVKQAKKNFNNLLPNLSLCNLLDNKDNPEQSRMIFSTYPTMMNAIDEAKREDGKKLFTPGHFDLIIIDESHRSIYKKYKDIFMYFDAMLLGLTATPKDEIDKNTYGIFELESGVPTYAYELKQAVEDGFLVRYEALVKKTKIMEDGIQYDQLSQDEKEEYENTFENDETIGDSIANTAINEWLFNSDTIDKILSELMEKGIKVEGGDKIGKTIIFARNSNHASAIVERFNKIYPEYGAHFIKQIDYSIKYVDKLIDDFSTKEKLPQIAVSVDMLDTGIDIPEIVNLVLFKKVRSKSKFWQMIGRGTRLCKDLFGPELDKEKFVVFDFCNNFDFFMVNKKGLNSGFKQGLTERIFNAKLDIVRELQNIKYQQEDYIEYREKLTEELISAVCSLNEQSFRVKMHLRYVEKYKNREVWQDINSTVAMEIKEHIAPIIAPMSDDELAKRFDNMIYAVDLAYLKNTKAKRAIKIIVKTAEDLSKLGTIPQVKEHKYTIEKVQESEFWENTDVLELEEVRKALRELIKFIDKSKQKVYFTNFEDEIIETEGNEEYNDMYNTNDLESYRKKVEHYLNEHKNELAIYKLRNNKVLNKIDLDSLEKIMWEELGSKEDYERVYGDTPITKLVRKVVGLDRQAANEAFSKFLSDEKLNATQIRFVKLIVDYVVKHGMIEDNAVLTRDPFSNLGSISSIFQNNMSDIKEILNIVKDIKINSETIA